MPLYEFECLSCGRRLEVLTAPDLLPKRCGPRCVADDRNGFGELRLLVSVPAKASPARHIALEPTSPEKAASLGFTTFKRRGKGQYERISGPALIDHVDARDLPQDDD